MQAAAAAASYCESPDIGSQLAAHKLTGARL